MVSFSDLEHLEIPISVTITGMIVGLIGATFLPWPWPNAVAGGLPANPGLKLVRVKMIGGESDPTYVQVLAEGGETTLKLINKDGLERLIKP